MLGLSERRWEQALELCRSAARDEFFDPIHYHNLARLHLAFGFKSEGLRLLRRGLMIAPDHTDILDAEPVLRSRYAAQAPDSATPRLARFVPQMGFKGSLDRCAFAGL